MFAEIIIDVESASLNQCFDYVIPAELEPLVKKGMRVIVSFGKQNTHRLGYIVNIKSASKFAKKPILELLDKTPFFDEEMFLLADEILKIPFTLKSSVYRTIFPKSLLVPYVKKIIVLQEELIPSEIKTYLEKNKWLLKVEKESLNKELQKLKNQKIIDIITMTKDDLKELSYENMMKKIVLKKKSSIIEEKKIVSEELVNKEIFLTSQQKAVFDKINLFRHQTYLLYYNNDLDKTRLYLKLIEQNLANQKQILLLVPEIILIKQLVDQIKTFFPHLPISVLNGEMTHLENLKQNQAIKEQKINLVIGTRMAIFSPLNNLGTIIIDQEHDESLLEKEKIPNYDSKELAYIRSLYHNIPLILSSSTPSLESYYRFKKKQYELLVLKLNDKAKTMKLIDMREELKKGNLSPLSTELTQALEQNIENNRKNILFINSKGFSPFVLCRFCSYVPKCVKCQQSLTFFRSKNILKCSFCGYSDKFTSKCPSCAEIAMKKVSLGIEYVEDFLQDKFPHSKIVRMDSETITNVKKYEKILNDFKKDKIDILLGTQIIAKNFNFSNVALVGVIMADILLNIPHFKASEKTFQLLTHIAKHAQKEQVMVQSYDTQHYAITSAVNYNINYFLKTNLQERKTSQNPPFVCVSKIMIAHRFINNVLNIAHNLKKILENNFYHKIKVLGPSIPLIPKKNNLYRVLLTIKYNDWPLNLDFIIQNHLQKDALLLFDRFANII
ncbi:replication restart helicase PriA [Vaccinium witches'-broom phytoplasma]|uniref:replication restart helicase PriA n=1 Tax=Vaccinium witches'-broom phytoplasma TaxID=85642 RepID=UPI000370A971|nr:primosomal protein N' [Vaccinium witches'-broom phytoplasma]